MRSSPKQLGETPAAIAAGLEEASIPAPVYPVILCGGSGERLWPASRPWRPKPFLALVGDRSGFQVTLERAGPLVTHSLLVVGGELHEDLIAEQLTGLDVEAYVLLEPAARNTGPAIAAAAAWVATRSPDAVLVVLPADHHIPDAAAFRAAVGLALPAAEAGRIVTLGVRPDGPATAYGYIRPGDGDGPVKPIAAFVEKPDAAAAAGLIADGALWNSGTFIASAATLTAEITRLAPAIAAAALKAVEARDGRRLSAAFAEAPSTAFDRAVMEETDRGAVLPVDFAWSDLGAWDAVAAARGERVLIRAAPGVRVEVIGLSDVAVVAEPDAVLVTALGHSQMVRDVAGLKGPPARYATLRDAAQVYDLWLRTAALPLWGTVGVDGSSGAFREALTWNGAPHDPRRRARVQARQTFVFASAATVGLDGPWAAVAWRGFNDFRERGRRADGFFAAFPEAVVPAGYLPPGVEIAGPAAGLYDHAFVLLALAALAGPFPDHGEHEGDALELLALLQPFRHDAGGWREVGDQPFQANAQMHLLEAVLAWEAAGRDPAWATLADELAELALARFIHPATGVLREFFDADWRALSGEAGLIEPGHQFEWAWLLERWGVARGREDARAAARRLFAVGRGAFDRSRGVVVNALWDDLSIRDPAARLWPQTEHLKAALVLGDEAAALEAANGLAVYLDTPARGVWRERMRPDGGFLEEPSPATSLYHLYLAIRELTRFVGDPC